MTTRTILALATIAGLVVVSLAGCGGGGGSVTPPPDTSGKIVIPAASAVMAGKGAARSRTLSTPEVTVTSGESVSLPVSVDEASGLAGATLYLKFDPSMVTCTAATSALKDVTVVANPSPSSGHALIVLAGATPAPGGRQTLATFVLKVKGTAGKTVVGPSGTVFDALGYPVASTGTQALTIASVTAARPGTIGDLMGTGLPSVGSALKILQVVAGLRPLPAPSALWQWDLNGDGIVDAADAAEMLRCVAGLAPWPVAASGAAATP